MENEKIITKAELLRTLKVYQDALVKIKGYCDNPKQFKNGKLVRDFGDCCAAVVGAVSFEADFALGLFD